MARSRLGRGHRRRRTARAVPPEPSFRSISGGGSRSSWRTRAWPTTASPHQSSSTSSGARRSRPAGPPAYDGRFRVPMKRRAAASRPARRRRSGLRCRGPGQTDVHRPGDGRDAIRPRPGRRLRHPALRRIADLSPRQHGRRRRLRDQPRHPRRGPAVVDAEAHPAHRGDGSDAGDLRPPFAADGAGWQQAVEAARPYLAAGLSRGRVSARGRAQLPGAARLVAG